ncbi:multicopper oxidase domain-containing protein, partial [Anoxybacillus sp. KU2-6(11)]
GNWMFHCHDLHHASAGMVTELNPEFDSLRGILGK